MPRRKSIDNDALFKELISDYFPDFVELANPDLYEAIDWEQVRIRGAGDDQRHKG
jgi:hypothetical protein